MFKYSKESGARCLLFILISFLCRTFTSNAFEEKQRNKDHDKSNLEVSGSETTQNAINDRVHYDWYHPLDTEIKEIVLSGEVKRLWFYVKNSTNPLTLTVTPCSEVIQWSLHYIHQPQLKEHKNVRKRIRRRRRHKWPKLPYKPIFVTNYSGKHRRTYSDTLRKFPGIYVVELSSKGRDARIELFLSDFYPYPLLPVVSEIRVSKVESNEISIDWNASPSEAIVSIEYLVYISRDTNLVSFCDAKQKYGESESLDPSLMTDTGFARWWGKTVNRLLAASRKVENRREPNTQVQRPLKRTWLSIKNLNANSTYYIDVIAINQVTNSSAVYKPLILTTPAITTSVSVKLKENELTRIRLSKSNNYSQIIKYNFKENSLDFDRSLWLFVHSCHDKGAVKITLHRNSKFKNTSEEVFDFKTIELKIASQNLNKSSNIQKLQIQLSHESETEVNVMLNKKHKKYPFPRFTSDRSVRVLHTLTTHDSITLAWTASLDEKVQYCVFQKQVHENSNIEATLEFIQSQNSCKQVMENEHTLNRSLIGFKKLLCRRYNKFSKSRFNDLIMQPIKNLKAASMYVFAVKVSKSRGYSLFLEPILASTNSRHF